VKIVRVAPHVQVTRRIAAAKPMPRIPERPLPETHGGGISRANDTGVVGEVWDRRPLNVPQKRGPRGRRSDDLLDA
jgi:hypothetical protein